MKFVSPSHFADPDAASVLPPKLPKGGAVLSSSRYRASAAIRTARRLGELCAVVSRRTSLLVTFTALPSVRYPGASRGCAPVPMSATQLVSTLPFAFRLLRVLLCFSRPIFPRLGHFKQSLSVFCIHRLRYADAIGCIFPVHFRFFHATVSLQPSPEEERLMARPCSERFQNRDNGILWNK